MNIILNYEPRTAHSYQGQMHMQVLPRFSISLRWTQLPQMPPVDASLLSPAKAAEKEEMPLLSPVTTPKSKVTPACKDLDYYQEEQLKPVRK